MAACSEFLTHSPDLVVPPIPHEYAASIRWEVRTWMNDCSNVSVPADENSGKLSSFKKLCAKRLPSRILFFIVPGFRQLGRT